MTAVETQEQLNTKEPTITTLPISKGGTGAGTAKYALFNLLYGINEVTSEPTGDTQLIFSYSKPTSSNGTIYKSTASYFKQYLENDMREATIEAKGLMSSTDKLKLNRINTKLYQLKIEEKTQEEYDNLTEEEKAGKMFIITDAASSEYVGLINDYAIATDTTWSSNKISKEIRSTNVATYSSLGTIKLGSSTVQTVQPNPVTSRENRTYAVQLNSNNQAVVNVPWINTESGDTNYTISMSGNNLTVTGTDGSTQFVNFSKLPYAGNGYLNASTYSNTYYKYVLLCDSTEVFNITGTLLMCEVDDSDINGVKVTFSVTNAKSLGEYSLNYSSSSGWAKLVKIKINSTTYIAIALYTGGTYYMADFYWNIVKSGSPTCLGRIHEYDTEQKTTELSYTTNYFKGDINGILKAQYCTQAQYDALSKEKKTGKFFIITDATSGIYTGVINDNAIATDTTWSSSKINTSLSNYSLSTHKHTKSDITDFPTLATVATSGSYNDLSNKPTILSLGNTSTTAAAGDHTHSNYVPTSRKVNGLALSSDISIITTTTQANYNKMTSAQRAGKLFVITDATSGIYTGVINDNAIATDTTWSSSKINTTYSLKTHNHDTVYVKQVSGKDLSTNDFTTTLKNKLDGIESGAQKNTITGVKGDSETSYRTGNVNITKANIGLGNVGNFKAVSTVASQGLTTTEKSNARSNIGAGTSSFSGSYNDLSNKPTLLTIGTTSTTAAAGNHNHDSTYLKLTGGTVTGNTIFSGGVVIPIGQPSIVQNGSIWIEK